MNKLIPENLMQYIEYLGTTVELLEDNLEIVQENTIPNEEIHVIWEPYHWVLLD